jgi:hypothetical protein
MSEVSDVRKWISDTGWTQWVSDGEARKAADIIARSTDPGDILKQLNADEVERLANNLPDHDKQQLLDDLARDLKADVLSPEQRETLRESFKELSDAFGGEAVFAALDRHGTQQTKTEFVKAFMQDAFSGGDVSHGTLLQIKSMLDNIPANQHSEVIAALSDQDLDKWASEIGAVFGNLSGEDKRKLFDLLTTSLDAQQLGRVARAIGDQAPEALLEFTEAVRAGTQEQKRAYADAVGTTISMDSLEDLDDPALTAAFLQTLNLDDREGYERALTAFASLSPENIHALAREYPNVLQQYALKMQGHQDWYGDLTIDVVRTGSDQSWFGNNVDDAEVRFSKEQLQAMRDAFTADDGVLLSGELLLAYPDRIERNQAVTEQYRQLATQMSEIVGDDCANWLTFGVWASDEVGRNLAGPLADLPGQLAIGDTAFWLSNGNTKLASDLVPVFKHFIDTYGNGRNRDLSFEKFWSSFEDKYAGRGLSSLEGTTDPRGVDRSGGDIQLDLKNAFKAYHEAMGLNDKRADGLATPADDQRRQQLMLYGNVLTGLQEQRLIQQDVENGLSMLGGVNPWGAARPIMDIHVPGRKMDLDGDVPADPAGLTDLNAKFTTADGREINLGAELHDRLKGLDGDRSPGDDDRTVRENTATDHWERYDERMAWIFHFFSGYHTDRTLMQSDPRALWGSRAENLDTTPEPLIRFG